MFVDPANYGDGRGGPGINRGRRFIIMHGTGINPASSAENELAYLRRAGAGVSYHWYIEKAGLVHHLVPNEARAWHAGASRWETADGTQYRDLNDLSIGVALESSNGVNEHYPDAQRVLAEKLVRKLMTEFDVPAENVLSHREVSDPIGRKIDPVNWNMDDFRARLGAPEPVRLPAYHPITNELLGYVTVVEGRKAYPDWLKLP